MTRSQKKVPKSIVPPAPAETPSFAIESVSIFGLFGKYDYPEIRLWGLDEEVDNVAFLYGENGVGKTTILRLIYSILTPERHRGHRTRIAKAKFKMIEITFGDGQKVRVQRDAGEIQGSYSYLFDGPRIKEFVQVYCLPDFSVKDNDNHKLSIVEDHLLTLTGIIFVTDQRTIKSTSGALEEARPKPGSIEYTVSEIGRMQLYDPDAYRKLNDLEGMVSDALAKVLKRTSELMVSRAMSGTSLGEKGANQVYLDITRAIVKSAEVKSSDPEKARSRLRQIVISMEKEIKDSEKYGILRGVDLSPLLKEIDSANTDVISQLISVIEPYIKSLRQRLDANAMLIDLMKSLEGTVNKFLSRKEVVVRLLDGISFIDSDGNDLEIETLSSGERHIVFLACAAVLSRNEPTVIMVDEPELSLNYKWQRELVPSLVALSGMQSQFILATHSFDIISGARKAVVSLQPAIVDHQASGNE